MNKNFKNELQCGEFEAILADALDQDRARNEGESVLSDEAIEAFEAHGRSCQVCGPLLADARQGMLLLRSIEEIEPPKNLLHNILAVTTMAEASDKAAADEASQSWVDRVRRSLRPSLAGLMRSRFATSFAMAFFSLSLTLTLAGVKVSDLSRIDWHPSALRRSVV